MKKVTTFDNDKERYLFEKGHKMGQEFEQERILKIIDEEIKWYSEWKEDEKDNEILIQVLAFLRLLPSLKQRIKGDEA